MPIPVSQRSGARRRWRLWLATACDVCIAMTTRHPAGRANTRASPGGHRRASSVGGAGITGGELIGIGEAARW